jgi:hypothetical protein
MRTQLLGAKDASVKQDRATKKNQENLTSNGNKTAGEAAKKRIRNINKVLKQIQKLEEMVAKGHALNDPERKKLERKSNLQKEIEALATTM